MRATATSDAGRRQRLNSKPRSELDPRAAAAHYNLGRAYARLARRDDAIKAYTEAIRIDRDYGEAHLNLALAYADEGRQVEAIAHYKEALRVKPDYAAARFNLALALVATGQRAAALDEERALRAIDSNLADQLHRLIAK